MLQTPARDMPRYRMPVHVAAELIRLAAEIGR